MHGPESKAAFWRLWRELGKAVWAVWAHMQRGQAEDSHQKGTRWQREFQAECLARGLVVEPPTGREDFVVNGLKVQCKAVDRNEGGIDIANMRPVKANNGLRGYLRSEADVFALRHRGETFLIPADSIDKGNGVIRPTVQPHEIQKFREFWQLFAVDYVPAPTHKQQELFSEAER